MKFVRPVFDICVLHVRVRVSETPLPLHIESREVSRRTRFIEPFVHRGL